MVSVLEQSQKRLWGKPEKHDVSCYHSCPYTWLKKRNIGKEFRKNSLECSSSLRDGYKFLSKTSLGRKIKPNQPKLDFAGLLKTLLVFEAKARPVRAFRWRWSYFRLTCRHHLVINLVFVAVMQVYLKCFQENSFCSAASFLTWIYSGSYQQSSLFYWNTPICWHST